LDFESCYHKKFHANSLCFKSSFICLKHSKKRTWIIDFIFSKVFFPYQMCTKCFWILLNSNVLHMKGSVFPNHLKIFYKCALSDFDTWTCLIIIIVLNLWSWFKIKSYISLLCHIWCENKYVHHVMGHIWYQNWCPVRKIVQKKIYTLNSHCLTLVEDLIYMNFYNMYKMGNIVWN